MPALVGPQTLTVGSSNTIKDPSQRGGNPSVAVQIQNSSPYQLQVIAAGETLSIQPFFAQTVAISDAPISVTPLAQAGLNSACSVTFAFLLGTPQGVGVQLAGGQWVETPPQSDGPLTAAAIASALSTQASIDTLANATPYNLGAAHTLALALAASSHSYTQLTIRVAVTAGASPLCAIFQGPNGAYYEAPFHVSPTPTPPNNQTFSVVLPCQNVAGSALIAYVVFDGTGGGTGTYSVTGATQGPLPLMRADGRAYPIGRFVATASATGNIVTPPAWLTALIVGVNCVNTGAGNTNLTAVINGSSLIVAVANGTGANIDKEWAGGILCDQGTGLVANIGAGGGAVTVTYDLVA